MPSGLRILLVEDHDILRKSTLRMLAGRGLVAQAVECAEDVDDLVNVSPFDIYIIDLNLPGEDGLQLARRVRRAQPQCGIIMFTARVGLEDRIAGYDSGADIYLCKPVDPGELIATISTLASRLRAYQLQPSITLVSGKAMIVTATGESRLSSYELGLLVALARANEGVLERWQVALHLGIGEEASRSNTLNARVSKLRTKLIDAGVPEPAIIPIRAFGYKLCFELSVV